jgi:hypothetical protein
MSDGRETASEMILNPLRNAMDESGITAKYLLNKLRRELNAKETKTLKFKGAISQKDLSKGFKVIGTSGATILDDEGDPESGMGDTHVQYDVIAWGIRQKARIDAHKLRGDYPAEKLEHSGTIVTKVELSDEDRSLIEKTLDAVKKIAIQESLMT